MSVQNITSTIVWHFSTKDAFTTFVILEWETQLLFFYFKKKKKPTVLQTWVNICDNILLIRTRSAIQMNFPLHKMKPFLEYLRLIYKLCMLGMGYLLVSVINHSSAILWLYLKMQTGVFYQLCMLGMGYLLVFVINHSSAIVWLYLKVQTSTRE